MTASSTTRSEELKPCPWCKQAWVKVRSENTACFCAECQDCAAKGPEAATYGEAIAAWNQRTPNPDDVLREALVEARAALDKLADQQEAVEGSAHNLLLFALAKIKTALASSERSG